jgi:hypothetical protein
VAAASETQLDPVVNQAFGFHPLTDAHFGEQVHGALLQHPSPNPLLNVLPAAVLDYDGIDAKQIQKVREH